LRWIQRLGSVGITGCFPSEHAHVPGGKLAAYRTIPRALNKDENDLKAER
jgi:hypothetical protein